MHCVYVDTVETKIKAHKALNAMYMWIQSILVFVAFTQHCIKSNVVSKVYITLYTGPLTPPRGKATVLYYLPSWGFSCSPVQGGCFVNFLGLVKLQE